MNAHQVFTVWCLLIVGSFGCAPKQPGPSGIETKASGVSTEVYPLPFETMWNETKTLFRNRGIALTGEQKEEGRGTLKGKTVEQQEVTVELLSRGADNAAVISQVGAMPVSGSDPGLAEGHCAARLCSVIE
jgi:hypothetical protein